MTIGILILIIIALVLITGAILFICDRINIFTSISFLICSITLTGVIMFGILELLMKFWNTPIF